MSTMTVASEEAIHQLQQELGLTRVGRRWQRLYHVHEREVAALVAVHDDVRGHLAEAAERLANATETRRLEPPTIRATSRVLDDLNRLGTLELRQTVETLREELVLARGGNLDDVLAD